MIRSVENGTVMEGVSTDEAMDDILNNPISDTFVRGLKIKSLEMQRRYIIKQLLYLYNNPPEDGNMAMEYKGIVYPEVEKALKNVGIDMIKVDGCRNTLPVNVFYISPEVKLSKEEEMESISYADRTAQEAKDRWESFLEELKDEDWDNMNDSDQRSIWRKFWDWFTGRGKEDSFNPDDEDFDDSEYDDREEYFDDSGFDEEDEYYDDPEYDEEDDGFDDSGFDEEDDYFADPDDDEEF